MLDVKALLQPLLRVVPGQSAISLRDFKYSYIIRSEVADQISRWRKGIAAAAMLAMWVCAGALWFLPVGFANPMIEALACLVLAALGVAVSAMIRGRPAAQELYVDIKHREMRAVALNTLGESWSTARAPFEAIAQVELSLARPDTKVQSLVLRIVGADELIPVAVGAQHQLIALQRRLLNDLHPGRETRAGYQAPDLTLRSTQGGVFPTLGPEELGT